MPNPSLTPTLAPGERRKQGGGSSPGGAGKAEQVRVSVRKMEADSEVKGKSKSRGFLRLRGTGDDGKGWVALRRNAAGPPGASQQAVPLPKPEKPERVPRYHLITPVCRSQHCRRPYLRTPGGAEKRASPFPPDLKGDRGGGAGGRGTHTPTHSSLNSAQSPAPRLTSESARSPFPPFVAPYSSPSKLARARGPRGIPAAGPFPGSPVPDCARRGDSSRPFPVKPRQGKKINATFQRKL